MRKITANAVNAFIAGRTFGQDNTNVELSPLGAVVVLKLHGNTIARYDKGDTQLHTLEITNAGWFSNTTKERLNALPGVSVCQRKGVWYLNGKEWDGSWTFVNRPQ